MATITGKRKRVEQPSKKGPSKKPALDKAAPGKQKPATKHQDKHASSHASTNGSKKEEPIHVQIVTGSYERVLHGLAARIPTQSLHRKSPSNGTGPSSDSDITFTDSFLFAAHASAIRCLAISHQTDDSGKRLLATGSSDERINVYSLSTAPPPQNAVGKLPSLTGTATAENPRNKSLGSLSHHDRAITRLSFPTKTKLFSAAEDATIAISRTRDWTMLSSIKAPIPKPQGRPSGDTAGPGEIPAGVNDFAIHPSQKLMLSVGRGERAMRLWNLMTGKKAGVLNFDRDLLTQVGEGKYASGEGRRVLWDEAGENFVVGFERGAVLFGVDCKPRAIIRPSPLSKMHQMRFLILPSSQGNVLALSTEDGRVSFFTIDAIVESEGDKLPTIPCIAQIGGKEAGVTGRVKDFDILELSSDEGGDGSSANWIVVTASSDGAIRLWTVFEEELAMGMDDSMKDPRQVGRLIAMHETGNRITCLGAFVMNGKVSEQDEVEEVAGAEEEEDSEDSDEE
ncbi:hypothetical protein PRZ48_008509 [Zasmidium cellare]|uniref:WD40 repeat-like protein n=1 Tax=Zasmidium cellare TaxID=395010 RepID=A0ABR0EGA8_ZASCE|nr:hypothetical protein PRZ48_008509 [Zasmidium cellare]